MRLTNAQLARLVQQEVLAWMACLVNLVRQANQEKITYQVQIAAPRDRLVLLRQVA